MSYYPCVCVSWCVLCFCYVSKRFCGYVHGHSSHELGKGADSRDSWVIGWNAMCHYSQFLLVVSKVETGCMLLLPFMAYPWKNETICARLSQAVGDSKAGEGMNMPPPAGALKSQTMALVQLWWSKHQYTSIQNQGQKTQLLIALSYCT